ncbi:MAG: coagulation factor 5/8 type [Frankiales bacterium]|nr:coagulation factor 5/8 type [Frankiales bacterium]
MGPRATGVKRVAGLVVPALLLVASILQSPGKVTFDTDLGLALNPTHLLHRAMHLWSAENGFGGVGDQTYGFLFPIGPFFALGELLGLPAWMVQRLWTAVVLIAAYEGARRLVRRMISPSVLVSVVGGLAWALSARMLTVVGPFSSEALTVALAPWLLLPLVRYLERDPRRAVWMSGIVVLLLGAANAGATVAVLPLPVLYLLTRTTPWKQRASAFGWWTSALVLASLWWIGPLLLLGANSPPFTSWVESARTTTDPVTAVAALRGTTDWVAYVPQGSGGFWPAAWELATSRGLLVATGLVAVLGLAGLANRHLPERRFLLLSALLGFVVLTLGHQGSPGSLVSEQFRSLLDGPAVPFRNIYKLDPVLRLPMVLGLAHVVERLRHARLAVRALGTSLAIASVLLAALPVVDGTLRPGPGFDSLPTWWRSAASYVAEHGGTGRTLILPEATAGQYTWGRTIGEPFEALATSDWAVRNQVPLTQAGNTRLVDAIEEALRTGRGSTALATVLARMGVNQLLVRNDLDHQSSGTLPPARVRQALDRSPGMKQVATFGGTVRADLATDGGLAADVPDLEVWSVEQPVTQVSATPLTDVTALAGGPEDLLTLLEQGIVTGPTVLATEVGAGVVGDWPGPRVLTDGLQRRERSFGRVHGALGPLLTADDAFRQVRAAHDLLPPGDVAPQETVATYAALTSVAASSSSAFPESFSPVSSGTGPGAALDGNGSTFWRSASLTRPVGQWLQVVRETPSDTDLVAIALVHRALFGPTITSLRLTTEAGSVVQTVTASEEPQQLVLPAGRWKTLRVTVASVADARRFGVVGIRELALPGITPAREVLLRGVLPRGSAVPTVVLKASDPIAPCLLRDGVTRCDATTADTGDETGGLQRTFTTPTAGELDLTGSVLPQQSTTIERLTVPLAPHLAAVSSSALDAGPVGAHAAVDGDLRTSWIAAAGDSKPNLTLTWPQATAITQIDLTAGVEPRASFPTAIHVHARTGDRDAVVGADGRASFTALMSDTVTLTFPTSRPTSSNGLEGGPALPLGIAEITIPGIGVPNLAPTPTLPTGAVCGFGPDVSIDGTAHHTKVVGTVGDLLTDQPLRLEACDGPVALTAGTHHVSALGTFEFRIRSLTLEGSTAPATTRQTTVRRWGDEHRTVTVVAGPTSLLTLPEAAGDGWHATLAGTRLTPLMVDGWAQGWIVPDGAGGTVHLDYAPDTPYRWSLLIGLLSSLLLLGLAVRSVRAPRHEPLLVPVPHSHPLLLTVLVIAGAAVVGSWAGEIGAVAGVLCLRLGKRGCTALPVSVLPAVATLVALDEHTAVFVGQASQASQTLCLLAFGALCALLTETRSAPQDLAEQDE